MTHQVALSATIILFLGWEGAVNAKRTRVSQGELDSDTQTDEQSSDTEEDSAYCWRTKEFFRKEKTYHFQIEGPKQNGTAFELVRNKKNPRLNLCKNCEWKLSLREDKIWWYMVDFAGKDQEEKMELSIFRDVAYIKRSADPSDDDLEIVLTNGERESIKGGIYFPEDLMYAGLSRYATNETFKSETDAIIEKTTPEDAASAKVLKTFKQTAGTVTVVSGTAGTALGALLGFAISTLSFWPGEVVAISTATLLSNIGFVGGLGLALGVGAGVIGGVVIGGVVAGGGALKRLIQTRRDLGLTASEKLFQELKCLHGMKVCGNGDIIYPWLSQCPE